MPSYEQSLFGCLSDTSQCCDTIFCPCYQVGHQYAAIKGQPHTNSTTECRCSYCCFWTMPFYVTCLRCKVSGRHQLGESCPISAFKGLCCTACSLCQTGRELNFRGTNPGGCMCTPDDMTASLSDQLMGLKNDIRNSNTNNNTSNVVVNVAAPSPPQSPAYYPQGPAPMGYPPQGYPPQGYPPQQQGFSPQ